VTLFDALVHMLTETCRHAGHADILRDQLDGSTGTATESANPHRDAVFWEARHAMAQARACATSQPPPARVRRSFAPMPASVPAARDLVAETCHRWRLARLGSVAGLVTSELVANAVRHAGTPLELGLACWGRYLHIAVRDEDPRPARLVGPAGEAEPGGRGLLIVDAISTVWGCTPTGDGKVTWATLSTATAPPAHQLTPRAG
jgi:hypothetical protein